jgi:uncharacterized protein YutE (UPF0331/DUF86 family)
MKIDDVILNKISSIRRCVERAKEEYFPDLDGFKNNFSRQDAAMLNIQRACEQAIDLANHLIKLLKLTLPNDARESFSILSKAKIIDEKLSNQLAKMIGFRNVIVHQYQEVNFEIVVEVIEKHLTDLLSFADIVAKKHEEIIFTAIAKNKELSKMIEILFNYYLNNKEKSSNKVNFFRKSQIIGALGAFNSQMFDLCFSYLTKFTTDEERISAETKDSQITDEEIAKSIAELKTN